MNLIRLESLIGKENVDKIKSLNILVLGLGGVGGYAVESLIRSGVSNITLVDGDKIKSSNLNRQIITTSKNINKYKTLEFKKRIKKINSNAKVTLINTYINKDNIYLLFTQNYDYIVDACDTTIVKILLMKECLKRNIKLISCMGSANKVDGTLVNITTLNKTFNDPLAKKIRKEFIENEMKMINVITSSEKGKKSIELGSTAYVPAIAGLLATNYIVKDVIGRNE
jgi:tRNA A37 threonylcarbamoyladenosine dehydratase